MEPDIKATLATLTARADAQDAKLELIYQSVEKTRQYFLWVLIGTVVMFLLPLLGLIAIIPSFLSMYSSMGDLGI